MHGSGSSGPKSTPSGMVGKSGKGERRGKRRWPAGCRYKAYSRRKAHDALLPLAYVARPHHTHTSSHRRRTLDLRQPAEQSARALARTSTNASVDRCYDGESGVLAASLAGRVHRGIRGGLVRVQAGRERDGAAGDAGLRVRAGRGLRAGGHGRELPHPRLRGGALLLRRQQLLPAEQPDQGRHLRLRRHRHPLHRRPQLRNLQVPCKRKCCRDEHRERHGGRLRRWRGHKLFVPGLDKPSYARHGRELHHADRQRVRPYGEHHRPREQRCRCRCGRFCWRPRPPRRCRGLRPRFLSAVLIMKQRET